MNYTLSELIDIDELQSLCEKFSRLTGFVTAILDLEGNILTATGWQDICTRFHRVNHETAVRCRESDVYLAGRLRQGERYTLYRCKNGLLDVAVPLTIEGRQVGNLYSGQFLFAPPDLTFFRAQAERSGFDEASYLEALATVPIVTEERVQQVMEFLCHLAEMIGRMGLVTKNARRASLVVENSPVVLFRWKNDEGYLVEFVSENVIQFGYAPEELLSGSVLFTSLIHPEDREQVEDEVRNQSRCGADTFAQEYRIVTKGGDVRWVDDRTTVERDENGRITHYQGILMDITERRRAADALATEKERLAVTLRSIGDGVITADVEGRVLLLNRAAEEMTGWTQEDAAGEPFDEVFRIFDGTSRESRRSPVELVLKSGNVAELAGNTILVAKDGRERAIADSGAPIHDRESRVVGVVLVFRDITEKRRMEEELFNARKLESLGILAGGIAHDFNNLLTAILGNISLSRMQLPGDDRLQRSLGEAEKASLRAKDLTQQLLTFSRGGAPVRKTVSLGGIIRESATFALSGSGATCRFLIPDDLHPVDVDEGQFSQVINNLVINADQAMPGGGEMEISCANVTIAEDQILPLPAGAYVRISVRDRGEGIPEDILPHVFDPYFTTKKEGKGLGLATVYSIVRNHDGHVSVSSVPGEGATFVIHLPASCGCVVAPVAEEPVLTAGRGRILVMDDEESIREVAGEMLSLLGYEVDFARDGAEAVERYQRAREEGCPFSAVLMDLTIPGGMGGREAIGRLREIDESVVGVVSSGYSNDPIMADYRSFGFSGVITKPYRVAELKQVLDGVL